MKHIIAEARKTYHQELLSEKVLTINMHGVPSNADSSSKLSIAISKYIADKLTAEIQEKALGQTAEYMSW